MAVGMSPEGHLASYDNVYASHCERQIQTLLRGERQIRRRCFYGSEGGDCFWGYFQLDGARAIKWGYYQLDGLLPILNNFLLWC